MKKNKKKLPRFDLGTKLGYQPNYGIGNYQFSSDPGESVEPLTRALSGNIIPQTLNKLQSSSSFALNALGNIVAAPTAATVIKPAASQAVYAPAPYGLGGRFGEETLNTLYSAGGEEMLKTAGSEGAKAGARTTLSTLGTALAGVGTVYGGIDMGMQIASNKDHRTAADMRNTLTTNTHTTDYGNTYTTHTGLDRSAELDYSSKLRLARNLNFTASSIGTGMSAGALFGGLTGSGISPGLGTLIGAGVGAVGGGIAYLAGLGDIRELTEKAMNRLTDVMAMGDRMSYSLARNKDMKQGFYSKTKPDGSMGAVRGKRPVYSAFGEVDKEETARVSNGELIGNFEDGYVSEVPGKPNNKDSKFAWLRPSDFVISNKYGLAKRAKRTGDYVGTLILQDILMNQYENRAKNGKLPKYEDGIIPLIIAASVPRIAGLASNWQLANELKNADTSTPVEYISDYGANTVPYQMMSNLPDVRTYLNRSDRNYKNYLYNIKRNPGLGPGGKAITMANAYIQKLAQDAETLSNIDTIRRLQINDALKLRFTEAQRMSGLKHDSWWKRREDRNRIISKFNDLRAAIPVNMYTIGSDLGTSISNIYQKKEALDQQAKLNAIFESKGDVDAIKAYTSLFNMLNNKPK